MEQLKGQCDAAIAFEQKLPPTTVAQLYAPPWYEIRVPESTHVGVSAEVGLDVGADVGLNVGTVVGRNVGVGVLNVGAEVGADVGAKVGPEVRFDVGTVVGAEVGLDVGLDVGADVGSDVGAEVGFDVGANVGSEVGGDVVTSQYPHVSLQVSVIPSPWQLFIGLAPTSVQLTSPNGGNSKSTTESPQSNGEQISHVAGQCISRFITVQ